MGMFSMILALGITVIGCDDGSTPNNGEDRTVQIRIDYAGSAETRATGSQIADDAPVAFSGGYLLFANSADAVTYVVGINTGSVAYTEVSKTVGITELKAGTQITAVPGTSNKVYFIGNAPSGMTAPAVGDAISSYSASVLSQYSSGTVANVSLFGGTDLSPVGGGAADEYEAIFNVKPIAARFEILAITGDHSSGGTLEYQIDGIFIDKYYDDMKLAGAAGTLKSNGSTAANYATGAGSYTITNGSVYDYNALGIANETIFSPSGVWNYNLLAPTSATMPAIIISISDVVVDGTAWPGQHFLTIEKFFDLEEDTVNAGEFINGAQITELAQGNIYVLDNITFDETNLGGDKPYIKTKKAQVKVTMLPWESQRVGWEF